MPRTAPARRARVAVLLTCVLGVSAPIAADATPTIAEALNFARNEFNALCDDVSRSRFDEIDAYSSRRSCRARIGRDELSLHVSYQFASRIEVRAEERTGGRRRAPLRVFQPDPTLRVESREGEPLVPPVEMIHSGRLTVEIAFDRRAYFLCGRADNSGRAPLYMNCLAENSVSEHACVRERDQRWGATGAEYVTENRRSFALLMSVSPEDCARLRNAMNFIVQRAPRARQEAARRYFEGD